MNLTNSDSKLLLEASRLSHGQVTINCFAVDARIRRVRWSGRHELGLRADGIARNDQVWAVLRLPRKRKADFAYPHPAAVCSMQ